MLIVQLSFYQFLYLSVGSVSWEKLDTVFNYFCIRFQTLHLWSAETNGCVSWLETTASQVSNHKHNPCSSLLLTNLHLKEYKNLLRNSTSKVLDKTFFYLPELSFKQFLIQSAVLVEFLSTASRVPSEHTPTSEHLKGSQPTSPKRQSLHSGVGTESIK